MMLTFGREVTVFLLGLLSLVQSDGSRSEWYEDEMKEIQFVCRLKQVNISDVVFVANERAKPPFCKDFFREFFDSRGPFQKTNLTLMVLQNTDYLLPLTKKVYLYSCGELQRKQNIDVSHKIVFQREIINPVARIFRALNHYVYTDFECHDQYKSIGRYDYKTSFVNTEGYGCARVKVNDWRQFAVDERKPRMTIKSFNVIKMDEVQMKFETPQIRGRDVGGRGREAVPERIFHNVTKRGYFLIRYPDRFPMSEEFSSTQQKHVLFEYVEMRPCWVPYKTKPPTPMSFFKVFDPDVWLQIVLNLGLFFLILRLISYRSYIFCRDALFMVVPTEGHFPDGPFCKVLFCLSCLVIFTYQLVILNLFKNDAVSCGISPEKLVDSTSRPVLSTYKRFSIFDDRATNQRFYIVRTYSPNATRCTFDNLMIERFLGVTLILNRWAPARNKIFQTIISPLKYHNLLVLEVGLIQGLVDNLINNPFPEQLKAMQKFYPNPKTFIKLFAAFHRELVMKAKGDTTVKAIVLLETEHFHAMLVPIGVLYFICILVFFVEYVQPKGVISTFRTIF